MSTLRDNSRQEWTGGGCIDQIKTGSLQRIADACELMAKNHAQLIDERDRYQRWWKEEQQRVANRDNTIRGLRGRITFLLREHPKP